MEKRNPIKRNTVIGCLNRGGLNVVDMFCKERAIKAAWIPKLLDSKNKCSIVINNYLTKQGLNYQLLLKMNFRKEDQLSAFTYIPEFYKSVFLSYNQCKYIKPVDKLSSIELLSQCLWGNEYFKVKGKTLLFKSWVKSGFIYVKDLINSTGSWLTEEEIKNKLLVKSNWMTEVLSIKMVLKKFLNDNDISASRYIQHTLLDRLMFTTRSKIYNITSDVLNTKLFYTILRDKKFERPYVEKMWEKYFNISLCNVDWHIIYMTNFRELKYKKFSEFKYKILHNILPCGKLVARWNKERTPFCEFCKEIEDIQHMLYSCSRIKTIWMHLGPGQDRREKMPTWEIHFITHRQLNYSYN